MEISAPLGAFTCERLELLRVRAPEFTRSEKDGVTYLSANGYELAYRTTLDFQSGESLRVHAKVWGELNRQIVVRDAQGVPSLLRGWIQGSFQLFDEREQTIFRGTYYDVNLSATLTGDEDLTASSLRIEHWEHGFGEGQYLGHAFTMCAPMTRGHGGPSVSLVGTAKGRID
jgi:hypothetical protein